jgi:CubicO group peptidase (beta-lactamase class C family)
MRKISLAAIGGLILSMMLAGSAGASTDYEQWLDEMYPGDGPGAAVIVVRDGDVVFRGASGMADLELGVSLAADHVFRLGSITKQFTAAGIMILEERGKLSVSDDIHKYLPDYPTQGHTITIEHLLTHTSGIFNYTNIPGYMGDGRIRMDLTTDELIEVFENVPMDFIPGEAWNYSNSGYVLLGAIIEKVSGQSYADFMQTAIFDKLDMKNSHYGGNQVIPSRVRGYQSWNGEINNANYLSMTQPHGAGSLLSTVDDLTKWTQALFGGELLSEETLKKMTTDFSLNNGEATGYGYGFSIRERFGEHEIAHNGGINGFSTSASWLPDKKVYVAVLSNGPGVGSPGFLAARMAFDAAGADLPSLEVIDVDPDQLPQYLGVYRIDENQTRNVLLEDGSLYTQRTGGGRSEIVPNGEDAFFYPGGFTHLEFVRDDNGKVIAMDVYQGGATEAERAEWESALTEGGRDTAAVSPEIYDLWAGDYAMDSGATLSVRRDGDQLFVQLTGQPELEIYPLSTDRYFWKVVDAELGFTAGDDGRGKTAVIYQNGGEFPANRVD